MTEKQMQCPNCGGGQVVATGTAIVYFPVLDDGRVDRTRGETSPEYALDDLDDVAFCTSCHTQFPVVRGERVVLAPIDRTGGSESGS